MAKPKRAFSIDSHITPEQIDAMVSSNPKLKGLVGSLSKQHGISKDRSKSFIKKMLRVLLDDFGETYMGEMSARLERIVSLRNQIVDAYDAVLKGQKLPEGVTPATLEGLFTRLDSEMSLLKSPTKYVKDETPLVRDDLASESVTSLKGELAGQLATPTRTGELSFDSVMGGQKKDFGDLDHKGQVGVYAAFDTAPDLVRRALDSTDESSLRKSIDQIAYEMKRAGLDDITIKSAAEGIDKLNLARNKERGKARGVAGGPYDPTTPEGKLSIEAIDRFYKDLNDPAYVKKLPEELQAVLNDPVASKVFQDPDLRKALEANKGLARLAHQSPTQLMEMWILYSKGGKKGSFGVYVFDRRTRSHLVGLTGEFTAAFQLGDSHTLLKGPDYDVTIPGTDLVAIAHKDGQIWLIDNKALKDASVGSVKALVENILPNMVDDVKDFKASGVANTNPQVKKAVASIGKATKELQQYLAGVKPDKIATEKVQKKIASILEKHGIKRVVTNAGGEVTGLGDALTKAGLELADLNK